MGENEGQKPRTGEPAAPYDRAVTQVIAKIRTEPFLFVIAVAALLVGLTVLAAGLGSPTLRFTTTVIGLLALLVILGYYLLEGLQKVGRGRENPAAQAGPASGREILGEVKVDNLTGDAELKGVRAGKEILSGKGRVSGRVDVGKAGNKASAVGVDIGGDERAKPKQPN